MKIKMMNKIIVFQIIFIIIVLICTAVQAFELRTTPEAVKSAEEFNFDIEIDQKIYLANGHLEYDPQLLEFVSCETSKLEIRENQKGDLAWVYVDSIENPTGISKLTFKFKAKNVATNMETELKMKDSVYIDLNDTIYESSNFIHPLRILAKDALNIPATGSSAMILYEGLGFLAMASGIYVVIKK